MKKLIEDLADHNLDAKIVVDRDNRHITCGSIIPTESYSDQPYVVKTNDGAWLTVTTTGAGHEGQHGQHVITMRSMDKGKTWTDFVRVEDPTGPEASYAVLLKANSGRIYCFYNHNTDNHRGVKADNPPYTTGYCSRVDSLGHFVFKYSDDHGKTWSENRYDIPMRKFEIDRNNADGGEILYFWNVGKPFIYQGAAFVSVHKVGGFGAGFFTSSEGALLKSSNILTETDPEKILWETLPDGDIGLRAPKGGGPVAEEQSYVVLSDGSFFCVYRTTDGHPTCCYSRDGGHTWSAPEYMTYPDGRKFKQPRAANFVWKCENGKYLYWFNNHSGKSYEDRNPAWICGGIEYDSPDGKKIMWSAPNILIYDDDTYIRMSYPDMIEEDGEYYITETQKTIARVHKIDCIEKLWEQLEGKGANPGVAVIERGSGSYPMPVLSRFLTRDNNSKDYRTLDLRGGVTLELFHGALKSGDVLIDTLGDEKNGILLRVIENGCVEITISDGVTRNVWDTCPGEVNCNGGYLTVIIDGGPKLILFVADGKLCDGLSFRRFGFGRYNPNMYHCNGGDTIKISSSVKNVRIYDRALSVNEAVLAYKNTL